MESLGVSDDERGGQRMITHSFLRERGLHESARARFKSIFPYGAPRNAETARVLVENFASGFMTKFIRPGKETDAYRAALSDLEERQMDESLLAIETLDAVTGPAAAVYQRSVDPFVKAYKEAKAALEKERGRAGRAYAKAVNPAQKVYKDRLSAMDRLWRSAATVALTNVFSLEDESPPVDRG